MIVNSLAGFDPDALGAAAGRVRAGGCLVLLTPPLADWPTRDDTEMARLVPYPFTASDAGPAYRDRLARVLGEAPTSWQVIEHHPLPPVPTPDIPVPDTPTDHHPTGISGCADCRSPDQAEAIERIMAVARGRPRRPLVLRSHRGRGKTSALGLAAARVLEAGLGDVLVTAPRREAVAPLFDRLAEATGITPDGDGSLRVGDCRLRFVPPDVLLGQQSGQYARARLLLIDEAAALPAAALDGLFSTFGRCVFATTEHGYEGSGRGFTLRFLPRLEASAVSVHHHWLTTPIRWAAGDPLEALIDRLLLLDADPAESLPDRALATSSPPTRLDPLALAADERRLGEWFGLLVAAHYRTTPRDLRQLLDGPASQLWAIETGSAIDRAVIATAATQDEGGLPDDLAAAVFDGERRLRGHLLPQTLAAHAGWPDWPRLTGRRIQRIAVHPAARRQGSGGELVAAIAATARDEGRDFVGASFGMDDELVAFWAAAGMQVLHLGQHRDHASGSQAVVMAMGLSPAGEAAVERAAAGFVDRLPTRAAGPLRHVEPERLATLLAVTAPRHVPALTHDQHRQLIACARHRHHLDAALDTLRAWLTPALTQPAAQQALEPERRALLIGRMLQLQDEATLADRFGLAGHRDVEATCRQALARLLDALAYQR
ncbi:tRNA(Met) cytidine acetyltransferase [Guyparkeria sp. SB14A]|uniref:GNAT family N-acetyltransferase n=1 Tax=Guyparkeria sp. SB14A TaxID=2571147 RepID=UPI0010ABFE8E|nr:GNAT family N-acetyltransferase [Guyparkeria sp. SB14A]TKA91116.1 tRNA(Met) cytidine acetyltransferase [Guyparkeria sp. SB14A]